MLKINIDNIITELYKNFINNIEYYSPKITWALVILLIWTLFSIFIYKFVIYTFKKFKIIEFIDKFNIKIDNNNQQNNTQKKENIIPRKISDKIKIDKIVAKSFSYYVFLIFFRYAISKIWIEDIESFLDDLLWYLPKLFIWALIWFFWIRFANFIHNVTYHTLNLTKQKTAKIIASWAKVIILFFTLMAVLDQVWIAWEITTIILIWFISMLSIAWWLAFWLWWKDVAKEILESFRK